MFNTNIDISGYDIFPNRSYVYVIGFNTFRRNKTYLHLFVLPTKAIFGYELNKSVQYNGSVNIKLFLGSYTSNEAAKYVFKTCERSLLDSCSYVRGHAYNCDDLIVRLNVIDGFMSDNGPLPDRFEKDYNRVFEALRPG